jgi:hypothetical protein
MDPGNCIAADVIDQASPLTHSRCWDTPGLQVEIANRLTVINMCRISGLDFINELA